MNFQYDKNISAHLNLVALINNSTPNDMNFDPSDLSFGDPAPIPVDDDGRNTQVTVTGIPGEGFQGDVIIKLRRNNLNQYSSGKDVDVTYETTVQEVINNYADANDIPRVDVWCEDATLPEPEFSENDSTVILKARSTSVVIQGQITLNLTFPDRPLDGVLTTTDLLGWAEP